MRYQFQPQGQLSPRKYFLREEDPVDIRGLCGLLVKTTLSSRLKSLVRYLETVVFFCVFHSRLDHATMPECQRDMHLGFPCPVDFGARLAWKTFPHGLWVQPIPWSLRKGRWGISEICRAGMPAVAQQREIWERERDDRERERERDERERERERERGREGERERETERVISASLEASGKMRTKVREPKVHWKIQCIFRVATVALWHKSITYQCLMFMHFINSVQPRGIVKTSRFTGGVCKNQ